MRADMRLQTNEAQTSEAEALRWLRRRLEWEQILTELRDAGSGHEREPKRADREPAAA